MKWLWIFLFRSICVAGLFHAVHRVMCSWPLAHSGDNSSLLKGCLSPHLLFPFCLSWETKPCAWAIFQRTHILSLLKKKKNSLRPWRGACLLKTPLKALSASFVSVSCQNGCNLNFTTAPWTGNEFHHSNIHFLSMVLSRLTLSHSHACQVIVWVSWEQPEMERKWEAWCFPISQSAFALGTAVGKGVS